MNKLAPKNNMNHYSAPKINNYLFWLASLILVFIIIANFWTILAYATGGVQQSGNTQIGGRITSVSPAGCQFPPPAGSGPDAVCVAAGCPPNPMTNGVLIFPFGYSATGFCPLVTMATTLGPISVANVGYILLGLFSGTVIGQPAIPLGTIGMAQQ